jgi:hypothetical protein
MNTATTRDVSTPCFQHVAEDPDPDDLIDQAAQARAEEQDMQEATHEGMEM